MAVKRGYDPQKLEMTVEIVCREEPLPPAYRNYSLVNSRNLKDMRECHIEPDRLKEDGCHQKLDGYLSFCWLLLNVCVINIYRNINHGKGERKILRTASIQDNRGSYPVGQYP